jgi:hypothetical protein
MLEVSLYLEVVKPFRSLYFLDIIDPLIDIELNFLSNNYIKRNTMDSCPDADRDFEICNLLSAYDEDLVEGVHADAVRERHNLVVASYEWCDRKYPGTGSRDWDAWADMASAAAKDVDIRLLIRGHSRAGYAILLFLEACYAVDKALCARDSEALAKVKMWHMPQEMRAYSYLLSNEMIQWWETELAELENEIKSPLSNRISLSWRIMDLNKCLAKLEAAMEIGDGIEGNIWTTMGEINQTVPPAGVGEAIYGRADRLRSSIKILRKTLKRSEKGDFASDTNPLASHTSVESGGKSFNEISTLWSIDTNMLIRY